MLTQAFMNLEMAKGVRRNHSTIAIAAPFNLNDTTVPGLRRSGHG